MSDQLERIIQANHHDPFQVLGVHFIGEKHEKVLIRTFQPYAESIYLVTASLQKEMLKVHNDGIYELTIDRNLFDDPELDPYNYQFKITYFGKSEQQLINDPYRFLPALQDQDKYLFNFGTNYEIYKQMGAHPATLSKIEGTMFRIWAPAASRISILGNFNGWDGRIHPMRSLGSSGIWELFLPGIHENETYKYEIRSQTGEIFAKIDPFQFFGELRPKTASITHNLNKYKWNDDNWQRKKTSYSPYDAPLSIYELHPGSWQRDPDDPDRFLTFRELAEKLIPYVEKLGFSHIELMPVMEHPLDESWGYQITAPFSLTSRFGTPEDFMYFVDQCHQADIGVLLDWVPAHFPTDKHSLAQFDGTALFEHEDPKQGFHPEWGTLIYNYGRKEVSNYLIANALFWIDVYHIDGLRVDAVASMLYLDYSRQEGEWTPNRYGGRENLEAIEFLRHLNSIVYQRYPGTLMIAEESTSFFGVSKPADEGGLGFGFKWNMGWMNDILGYFSTDPLYRRYDHNSLTFSMMYAFSENFILPLSHDEVVHGKKSLLDKMPGDIWQKFANLRLLLLGMWCHPGKKLLFMGAEFGQWLEWNCKQSLDFHLLDENIFHKQTRTFVGELNKLYKKNHSLWEQDFTHEGFQWLDLADRDNSIISFIRYAKNRDDHLVCLLNHTPQTLYNYTIGLPTGSRYKVAFCSDDQRFGGSNANDASEYTPTEVPYAQGPYQSNITVPPLAGIILKPVPRIY